MPSIDALERLDWHRVRGLASRLTTPLHPDDYLSMINPLWTRSCAGHVCRTAQGERCRDLGRTTSSM